MKTWERLRAIRTAQALAAVKTPVRGIDVCYNCGKGAVSALNGLCVLCHELWRDYGEVDSIKVIPGWEKALRDVLLASLTPTPNSPNQPP